MSSPLFKIKIKIIPACQYVYWKALHGVSTVQSRWLCQRVCKESHSSFPTPYTACMLLLASLALWAQKLDFNQTHFSHESKLWSKSKPVFPWLVHNSSSWKKDGIEAESYFSYISEIWWSVNQSSLFFFFCIGHFFPQQLRRLFWEWEGTGVKCLSFKEKLPRLSLLAWYICMSMEYLPHSSIRHWSQFLNAKVNLYSCYMPSLIYSISTGYIKT